MSPSLFGVCVQVLESTLQPGLLILSISSVAKNSNSSSLLLLPARNLLCFFALGNWNIRCDARSSAFCGPAFLVDLDFNAFHLFVAFPYTNQPCYFVCYVGFEKWYKMAR